MKWDVKGIERGLKVVAGRIAVAAGTPSVVDGDGFTLTDVAAGKVRVTLADPGKAILSAIGCSTEATDATAHMVKAEVESSSAVLFRVYVADATDGALVDNVGFSFLIVAKDTRL